MLFVSDGSRVREKRRARRRVVRPGSARGVEVVEVVVEVCAVVREEAEVLETVEEGAEALHVGSLVGALEGAQGSVHTAEISGGARGGKPGVKHGMPMA